MTEPLVAFSGVTKTFGNGFTALREVSFAVQAGVCHAICGENGAGKSTLMKILFGLEAPTAGRVLIDGTAVAENSPRAAAAAGIGMVHQHFSLVGSLSVAENLTLGREPRRGPLLDRAAARCQVRALAERYRLHVDPDAAVGSLSVAAQQKVEILKALARRVRLLILDEPTAVLTPQETEELFERLGDLRAAGLTILFISHKLREIRMLASHVTVLRNGRVTGDAEMASVDDDAITRMVMGRDIATMRRPAALAAATRPVLTVRGLAIEGSDPADRLHDIELTVGAGEILGVAGVDGNGQRGLVSVLTGLRAADAGRVELDGRDLARAGTARWRALGMGHLPADRFAEGGARSLSLTDNAIGGSFRSRALGRWPLLSRRAAEAATAEMVRVYDVRCRSVRQPLGALSGGNAQKLIAAREFGADPKFLVADQPTRGIDIQAAAFIRARLLALAQAGAAILLVTADLDELLALAGRVVVLFGGRIVARLDNDAALTPERLGAAMLGLERAA